MPGQILGKQILGIPNLPLVALILLTHLIPNKWGKLASTFLFRLYRRDF